MLNLQSKQKQSGFTIVELLIVVVVIAILAVISVVVYNGIQQRARDAKRLSDLQVINKAIQSYYAVHGDYPQQTASPGYGAFEISTDTPGTFLEHLKNSGFLPDPPLDPVNSNVHFYGYFRYPVGWGGGSNGCDDSRGVYYVLYANRFESTSGKHPNSPGFSCDNRNWQGSGSTFQWVTGGYVN